MKYPMKHKAIINTLFVFFLSPLVFSFHLPAYFRDCQIKNLAAIANSEDENYAQNNIISNINISNDVFNPYYQQNIELRYILHKAIKTNIKIYSGENKLVRNLISNTFCEPGTYGQLWDGKDDQGNIVADGVYYFIIEDQSLSGIEVIYNSLRTGDKDISRNINLEISSCNTVKNELATLSFSLPQPAYITAVIREEQYSGKVIRTLSYKVPMGKGKHAIVWDGRDDAGNIVEIRNYGVGFWAQTLVDNAIIVEGSQPFISDIKVEPIKFNPMINTFKGLTPGVNSISFDLSCDANVTVAAYNAQNLLVVKLLDNVFTKKGKNSLIWCGKNDYGEMLSQGGYRLEIKANREGFNSQHSSAHMELRY